MDKVYVVDHIVDATAVLEDISSNELIYVDIYDLPDGIYDGMIVRLDNNGSYSLDMDLYNKRINSIRSRFDMLKRNSND